MPGRNKFFYFIMYEILDILKEICYHTDGWNSRKIEGAAKNKELLCVSPPCGRGNIRKTPPQFEHSPNREMLL